MRSVVVVLPASMCAMIPMFRQRFRGIVPATLSISHSARRTLRVIQIRFKQDGETLPIPCSLYSALPAVVGECLVGLGHAVYIFLLLHRRTATIRSIKQLGGQLLHHALLAARPAISDQPADGERGAALGQNFDRHLVVRSTDAAALDFEQRLAILDGLLEQLQGLVATLLFKVRHSGVEDALGGGLLAAPHHGVDELCDQGRLIDRVGSNFTLRDVTFSRHLLSLLFFLQRRKPLKRLDLSADSLTCCLTYRQRPWDAWRRTSTGSACGWRRR